MKRTTILIVLAIGLVFGGCHRKAAKEGVVKRSGKNARN